MKNLGIVVAVILFLLAVYSYLDSYHNVDIATNAFANDMELFYDEGAFGNRVLVKEMYMNGIRGMFISFWIYNILVILLIVLYLRKVK